MKFAQLLREYMEDRTLDEVVGFCEWRGIKLDRTYLSKLRTGARPAPDSDDLVTAPAAACGKPSEPLLLLARYERNPQVVMEELISSWVTLDRLRERIIDDLLNEHTYVLTMLEQGDTLDLARNLNRWHDRKVNEQISVAEDKRQDLLEQLELLSDRKRVVDYGARPGTMGTLTRIGQDQWMNRTSALIERLATANNIPVTALWAAVATAKAAQDPKFDVAKWLADELRPEVPEPDDEAPAEDSGS